MQKCSEPQEGDSLMNANAEKVESLSKVAASELLHEPEVRAKVENAGELGFSKSSWGSAC
jgi:hypothetical protein